MSLNGAGFRLRADLNGDGTDDVFWQNNHTVNSVTTGTGETYAWLMNGLTMASTPEESP